MDFEEVRVVPEVPRIWLTVLAACMVVAGLSAVPAGAGEKEMRSAGEGCSTVRAGTPGDDELRGTLGPDRMNAYGGDDLVNGLAGNDCIRGGHGADDVSGGRGDDLVFGGGGPDVLSPGPGEDKVLGGPGRDRIFARDGERDIISCGKGRSDPRLEADPVDRVTGCGRSAKQD
jgi:hypothetical protein